MGDPAHLGEHIAFAMALRALYLAGNPSVPESEWAVSVRIASWVGPGDFFYTIANADGLDTAQVRAIGMLLEGNPKGDL